MSPLSSVKIQRRTAGYRLQKSMAMFPVRQKTIRLDVDRFQSSTKLSQKLMLYAKVISAKVTFRSFFRTHHILVKCPYGKVSSLPDKYKFVVCRNPRKNVWNLKKDIKIGCQAPRRIEKSDTAFCGLVGEAFSWYKVL